MLTYRYTGQGDLHSITTTENSTTVKYVYNYDSLGRLTSGEEKVNGTTVLWTRELFNNNDQLLHKPNTKQAAKRTDSVWRLNH